MLRVNIYINTTIYKFLHASKILYIEKTMDSPSISAKIISTGTYFPEKRVTTEDFLRKGISQETINKLGILEHRVCHKSEDLTDMEEKAARIALERAGLMPQDLDLIISGPILAEECGRPNSNLLQAKLGATNAAAFDIFMACSGIIPQLMTAASLITLGQYKYILVTNAVDWTRMLNPNDMINTVVLGDGAGAAILEPVSSPWGFMGFDIQTEGKFYYKCGLRKETADNKVVGQRYYETSEGKIYFYIDSDIDNRSSAWARYLLRSIPKTFKAVLNKTNLQKEDVDVLIMHQNINPLVNGWIKLCGVPKSKTITTHYKYGNLASANILTNLNELIENNRLKKGNIVAMVSQGAGFSVGSAILKWG